jgi:hypothetical protein
MHDIVIRYFPINNYEQGDGYILLSISSLALQITYQP